MDTHTQQEIGAAVLQPEVVPVSESTATITQRPVDKAERISTVDMIRGVALCGILLMNIPGFGFHWSGYFSLIRGPHNTADFYTLEVVSVFFEGTMRGLFSMLFGAGMILFTMNKKESLTGPSVGELYYRRLLLLVGFGVFNAYVLQWWGDILYFYGLGGMLLYPFRKTAAKWLIALGLFCFSIGMIKNHIWYSDLRDQRAKYHEAVKAEKEGKKLTDEQTAARTAWMQRENRKPNPLDTERDVAKVRGDYGSVFAFYLPRNSFDEAWGMSEWGVWDSVAMMLIGMALFRLGYFSNKPKTSTYLMGLLLGYGIGIPVSYLVFSKGTVDFNSNIGAYVDAYSVDFRILYDVKRICLSVGHASLIMLVFRSKIIPGLMRGLANVGQMAFTNYLMQSIICTLFFHGYGLGFYNKLSYHQLYYVVGSVWVFQLIASTIWLRYFRFGPFEWVWRSMTYLKAQPMKLKREGVAMAA